MQVSHYVIVGAGPVGRETARLLAEQGHSVILTNRNAGSLDVGGVRTVSSDATDVAQLAGLAKGADAIFMCAMAAYHRWPTEFFPIMDGTVKAAEQVGARLLVAGNVYGYGAAAVGPLTPDLEPDPTTRKGTTRHIMWQRALRSNVPAVEVRASDYLGQGAVAYFSLLALPSLLKNEPVSFLGDPDVAHAWSFTKDTAKTLVAASRFTGKWGRAFHVPSQSASVRELVRRFRGRAEDRGSESASPHGGRSGSHWLRRRNRDGLFVRKAASARRWRDGEAVGGYREQPGHDGSRHPVVTDRGGCNKEETK
jgi:nucleoside-diphosphate-sugar epimerase